MLNRKRLNDKRQAERHSVRGPAKIQLALGAFPRDCWISDISDGGARLFAEGIEVPEQFTLVLAGPAGRRRECRVVWRLGHEIGAEFIDAVQIGFARHVVASQRKRV